MNSVNQEQNIQHQFHDLNQSQSDTSSQYGVAPIPGSPMVPSYPGAPPQTYYNFPPQPAPAAYYQRQQPFYSYPPVMQPPNSFGAYPSFGGPSHGRSLHVRGLSNNVTEELLYEIFSFVGPVESCKICKDRVSGQSAGYGFVDYYDERAATLAIQQFNGRRIYDNELKVSWAASNSGTKEDTSGHFQLWVGDLSSEIDDKTLWNAFSAFGSISDARVVMDAERPDHSRGFGFVAFRNKEDAQKAMNAMNGEWLGKKAIRCDWAIQKGAGAASAPSASSPGTSNSSSMGPSSSNWSSSGGGGGLQYNHIWVQCPPENTTVYVGNLSPDVNQAMLDSAFSPFGAIEEIRVQAEKGFAFVRYRTHDDATSAICAMHGKIFGSKQLKCSWGKPPSYPGVHSSVR
jgi:nucleolysin TIA-1/TIAR